jgi:uncharacterized membrane protein YhhN
MLTGAILATLSAVAAAVAGLVLAERSGSKATRALCKPVASTGFVVLGVLAGGGATLQGRWVLAALVLGWIGDVLLLGRGKRPFVLGLGSFLLGHGAFGVAFVVRGVAWWAAGLATVVLLVAGRPLWSWLEPHVPRTMRAPVIAYVAVISCMVALAVGTATARPGWVVLVAALMFAASDVSVARDRFMHAGWSNKAWGLPLYYAAQCALALTAAGP